MYPVMATGVVGWARLEFFNRRQAALIKAPTRDSFCPPRPCLGLRPNSTDVAKEQEKEQLTFRPIRRQQQSRYSPLSPQVTIDGLRACWINQRRLWRFDGADALAL